MTSTLKLEMSVCGVKGFMIDDDRKPNVHPPNTAPAGCTVGKMMYSTDGRMAAVGTELQPVYEIHPWYFTCCLIDGPLCSHVCTLFFGPPLGAAP